MMARDIKELAQSVRVSHLLILLLSLAFLGTSIAAPQVWAKFLGKTDVYTITVYEPKGERVTVVDGGRDHSLAISSTGQLYGWGYNSNGMLGTGNTTLVNVPTKNSIVEVGGSREVKFADISPGHNMTFGLDRNGDVWAWGLGTYGRLGLGNTTNYTTPQKVTFTGNPKIEKITSSIDIGIALDENGKIWVWGNNASSGVFGNGTTTGTRTTPALVTNFGSEDPVFVDVEAPRVETNRTILALDSDGSIWGWGENLYGIMSTGNQTRQSTPMKIYNSATGQWANPTTAPNGILPYHLPAGTKMEKISLSYSVGLAIDEHGNMYSWGSNYERGLGTASTSTTGYNWRPDQIYNASTGRWKAANGPHNAEGIKMTSVKVMRSSCFAIDEAGSVYSWGNGNYGVLGSGSSSNVIIPMRLYNAETGLFNGGQSLPAGTKMDQVTGNFYHAFFLAKNGDIFTTGEGEHRKLGNGILGNRSTPVKISEGIAGSAFPLSFSDFHPDAPPLNK